MEPRIPRAGRWLLWLALLGAAISLRGENRILIPVKINDQPVRCAFDTGAERLFLWHHAAVRLGLKLTSPPPDQKVAPGQVRYSSTEPVTVELFGNFPGIILPVLDDPPGAYPTDIDGVVGWSNMRHNRMSFHGPSFDFAPLAALPANLATWVKLAEQTDYKILALRLPGKETDAAAYVGIDTGSPDGVLLAPAAWERWRTAHAGAAATIMAYYTPGAGLVSSRVMWSDEIDLQGLKLRDVPVSCMDSAEVSLFPPGTKAVLGLAALRRLEMVFDGSGTVYAMPTTAPRPAYQHNKLGAVFMPAGAGNDALVAQVVERTPAAKAGVRDGDILQKIDDLDVTPWRTKPGILPLSRFWQQASGTKLHLTLQRDGKTFTADAVLKNILGPDQW